MALGFRRKSDVCNNLVGEVGLGEFDGPVCLLFDMDIDVILNFSFICQLVAFFEFVDDVVY